MKTLTRVYDTYAQAREVIGDLRAAGIPDSTTSLLANKHVSAAHDDVSDTAAGTGIGIGAAVGGGAGLLAGLGLLAIPGIGPVVAAGWLASTALGAAVGGAAGGLVGGLVGVLVDAGVPKEHAEVYSEAVRRGGTLVTVRAQDDQISRVTEILDRHKPLNPVKRGDEYRKAGWKGYDPNAQPYTLSDSERERIRAPYSR